VWSEVFARCDDASVSVRWSGFEALTATGQRATPGGLLVNYQDRAAGGCNNTTVRLDDRGVLQTTHSDQLVAVGTVVPLADGTAHHSEP